MTKEVEIIDKIADTRGNIVVFWRSDLGQIYFVTFAKKGTIRGNHYHNKATEWLGIIAGRVELALKEMRTGKISKILLDSEDKDYKRVKIEPNTAHAIMSLSDNATLLSYSDEKWQKEDVVEEIIYT